MGQHAPDEQESVTHWLYQLSSEEESTAQQKLWNRYFTRVAGVARSRLKGVQGRDADEEDVALSVLDSFFRGAQAGRFPDLHDRTGLWPLLVKITARKAINEHKRQHAKKRSRDAEEFVSDLGTLAGAEPTPQFAIEMAEQVEQLLARLEDDELRAIAVMKLEGYANAEIATRFDVAERTIARKLARIRIEWE
ncbi:ECF-type sigma factor [Pirellulales bacterium]|nr:ECF-type sigma factor [Pirellulales bacterium]